jgi:peptidoglycan hydrolase-like protein with peptidoglycan-binding domain
MRPPESFIGQPIRSLQTMLRVIGQKDNGLEALIPDGIYGPETVRVVSAIQRSHGLPVTGVTDQGTWEMIVALYETALIEQDEAQHLQIVLDPGQVIRRGERHPHLYLVQAILAVLSEVYGSIPKPESTGILDGATEDSLFAFQQLAGLPGSGRLDKHTWKALALHYPLAANLNI